VNFCKKGTCTATKIFCAYFTYLPKSPPCADLHEILHEGHLADVINRAKFYLNQIRGFDSVMGRIFGFPIGKKSPLTHG